jgi:hypothetical protein
LPIPSVQHARTKSGTRFFRKDGSSTLKPQAVISSCTMVLHPEDGGQEFRPEDLKTQMQFILK